jgi:Bacterial Ig-like domain
MEVSNLDDNCADRGECRAEAECSHEDADDGVACADGAGECNGEGECVVPDKFNLGETCSDDDQCGSGSCAATTNGDSVCCSAACEGTCQACGADGQCNKTPSHDDGCDFSCPGDTSCTSYPDAPANNCIGFGVCLSQAQFCAPSQFESGIPCGASAECDGSGSCLTVDRQSPTVVSITPDDDVTEVERDVVIEVTFSEPIDESTINDAVTLSGPDGEVPITVTMLDATTLAVSPNVTLR